MPDISTLTHSPADVVRWLLIAAGQGTEPITNYDWPIHVSLEPDYPEQCITIYDTGGVTFGNFQPTGEEQEYPGLMIQVRSNTHKIGYQKTDSLTKYIDQSVLNQTVTVTDENGNENTYKVNNLIRQGTINNLGKDPDDSRFRFTVNFLVSLRQTS